MLGKISNKNLSLIFLFLLAVALIFLFVDGDNKERTFRRDLVDIDTASATRIVLFPKSENYKEVELVKYDKNWKVKLYGGREVLVPDSKIRNLFNTLTAIIPKRLAGRGVDKWKDFEVDSTGTRVKVYEGSKTVLDIIIGRFSFQQPRSMSTYVRLSSDSDVYEVEGFLAAALNQSADNFRDNTIIKSDYENWKELSFADASNKSSFKLAKLGENWFLDNIITDSTKTAAFLLSLQRLNSTDFIELDEKKLHAPLKKLIISSANNEDLLVEGFHVDSIKVIRSSINPGNLFDGNKSGLWKKIFIERDKLL